MTYDPNTPPVRQHQPWSCSICTATWMRNSLGDPITSAEMQGLMVPGLVTPEKGLLMGDGSQLAPFLERETGLTAHHQQATWELLTEKAGTVPIGIGSGTLYHWVAVAGVNEDGSLQLANPAPGYQGLGDTMTRAQFARWAPWQAVWLDVPVTDQAPEEDPQVIDDLTRQLDEMTADRDRLQALYTDLNNWSSSAVADVIQPGIASLDRASLERGQVGWKKVKDFIKLVEDRLDIHP